MRRARVLMVMTVLVGAAAPVAQAREGTRFREAVRSHGGVVASVSGPASRAGVDVLDGGGNAIDAAVTTAFAVSVTRPEMCGPGGGGFLVYRSIRGRTAALDFRETAPAHYAFTDGAGGRFGTGHGVVGVPGFVDGMSRALRRFGTIRLARAIAPAARLAADGVRVGDQQALGWAQHADRLRAYAETARVFLKAGALPYLPGERFVQADYARTLRGLAAGGARWFYRGPIADAIAREMEGSGTVTRADLAGYRAKWRRPITGGYRGRQVVGMPPPSSGGLAVQQMLNLLAGFDAAPRSSADRVHVLAEVQKLVWADRDRFVGDPDTVAVPVGGLLSPSYADARRGLVDPARAQVPGPGAPEPNGHTTHISVIDARGNAAALTCSIEQAFGSAVVAPGTGFLLNNQLTDFSADPSAANGWAPGKRPRSSMSPTIVAEGGRPQLVTGGAGGPSIIMSTLQSILDVVDHGMDIGRALDAERIDARGLCPGGELRLCLEAPRFSPVVIADLAGRGHEIVLDGEYGSYSAELHAASWLGGWRYAAADPRGEGSARGGARGQ